MPAQIFYQAFEFSAGGSRPWYGVSREYVAESDGAPPQKANVRHTVKTWFLEPSFADNQTRYRTLLTALHAATEGVLRMVDENGLEIVNARVQPVLSDLPEQWGEHLTEVTVVFRGTENLTGAAAAADIAFTASGAGTAITLPNVGKYSESIRANRYSPNLPNRRESIGAIVATGVRQANPADDLATRRTYLMAQKTALQAVTDCKEGALAYLGETRTVRVESFDAQIDDASRELRWSLQASYQRFPAGDYAEAEFTVTQRDNQSASERLTSVRGKVRADDEAGALAKVTAIQGIYATGRMLLGKETGTPRLSGVDGDTFVDVDFSLEFREVLAVTSYKLSISTRDDTRTGQVIISYSGTVTSSSSAAALTQARTLGDGMHPIRMSAQETVETLSVAGAAAQLTQVAFAYEYLTKGTALYAEVTSEMNRETFGGSVQNVNGYAVADTEANALTLARSFKPGGLMQRGDREAVETLKKDSNALFVKVSFSYAYHVDAAAGAIQYGVKVTEDLLARESVTTYSGVAFGPDEASAEAMIDGVVSGASGARLANDRESKWDKTGAFTKFISRSFTVSYRGTLAADGADILEAEFSVENVYSVDKAILTEIPYSTAHVQTGCGTTIGYRRVSGRMVCLTAGTAVSWARAKQPSGGYFTGGDKRERTSTRYYKFSDTSVQAISFDFDYSMAYTNLAMT